MLSHFEILNVEKTQKRIKKIPNVNLILSMLSKYYKTI